MKTLVQVAILSSAYAIIGLAFAILFSSSIQVLLWPVTLWFYTLMFLILMGAVSFVSVQSALFGPRLPGHVFLYGQYDLGNLTDLWPTFLVCLVVVLSVSGIFAVFAWQVGVGLRSARTKTHNI